MKSFMRLAGVLLTLGMLAACQSFPPTTLKRQPGVAPRIVVVKPEVDIHEVQANGDRVAMNDRIAAAQGYLDVELPKVLTAANFVVVAWTPPAPGTSQADSYNQMMKLHRRVHEAIVSHVMDRLPTMDGKVWSMGPTVREVVGPTDADYALLVNANDRSLSAGRVARNFGIGLLTGPAGMPRDPGNHSYISIIDLKSGDVVWSKLGLIGLGDFYTEEGARKSVATWFESLPK
ncbi:MAG: hypothetical protein ACM33T_11240 [Solirubrobacterales bacterium]